MLYSIGRRGGGGLRNRWRRGRLPALAPLGYNGAAEGSVEEGVCFMRFPFRISALRVPTFLGYGFTSNGRPAAARAEFGKLVNQTKDSVLIVSGDLHVDFYGHENVAGPIKAAVDRGVTVKIAYGPSSKHLDSPELKYLKSEKIECYRLNSPAKRHLMVFDGKHARIEQHHPPNPDRFSAIILHDAPEVAKAAEATFARLTKGLEPSS